MVVQYFLCRKSMRLYEEFSGLCQDADVMSLEYKSLFVRCFVCRDYDKILMETGNFYEKSGSLKMDSCLVLTE